MSIAPPTRYSAAQKWLHWLIAAIILSTVPVGLTMTQLGEGELTNRLYELHKSLGLVILALALVRIAVRLRRGAPPLEPGLPAWQQRAAHASHYALYVLIVGTPIVGWAATSACCPPVKLFWTVPVTLPMPRSDALATAIFWIHYGLAFTLIGIVAVHVGAALQHHFIRRDRTLLRMLPGRTVGS